MQKLTPFSSVRQVYRVLAVFNEADAQQLIHYMEYCVAQKVLTIPEGEKNTKSPMDLLVANIVHSYINSDKDFENWKKKNPEVKSKIGDHFESKKSVV